MPYWSITSTEIKMYHIPVMIGDNKNSYFFLNPHAGIFPSRQIDKTPPYYSIYKPMELRWKSHGIYKMIYYKMIYFNIYYKHKKWKLIAIYIWETAKYRPMSILWSLVFIIMIWYLYFPFTCIHMHGWNANRKLQSFTQL